MAPAADGIRIYAQPSHASALVAILPAGRDMTALRREGEWVLVQPMGEFEGGWVYAPLPPEPQSTKAASRPPSAVAAFPASAQPQLAAPHPGARAEGGAGGSSSAAAIAKPDGMAPTDRQRMAAVDIARLLMKASMAGYSGNCACPDHIAQNGNSCGKRSAYCRPGGRRPLCYLSDVTPEMIASYRQHGNAASAIALQQQPNC